MRASSSPQRLILAGDVRLAGLIARRRQTPSTASRLAFVRPHDVVLCRPENAEPSEDAKLPDAATVRLVTALGPKAWVELSYGSQVVAAEITRDALAKLRVRPGSRCTLQLRLPCFFARR